MNTRATLYDRSNHVRQATRRAAYLLAPLVGSLNLTTAHADAAAFCLGDATKLEPAQKSLYDAYCPTFLQQHFAAAAVTGKQATQTTKLTQQQAEANLLKTYADMTKAAPAAVPTGFDAKALGVEARRLDAVATYRIAAAIGVDLQPALVPTTAAAGCSAGTPGNTQATTQSDAKLALLVSTAERTALTFAAASPRVLTNELTMLTARTKALGESCKVPPGQVVVGAALPTIQTGAAILYAGASVAELFQSQLLAASTVDTITDPTALIAAGISAGLDTKRSAIRLHVPVIDQFNKVVEGLRVLDAAIHEANGRLAKCAADSPLGKQDAAILKSIVGRMEAIQQSDAGAPSILSTAARRQALEDHRIEYLLTVSRDLGAASATVIKPNAFRSARVASGTAVVMSYQLVKLDSGELVNAGCFFGQTKSTEKILDWSTAAAKVKIQPCSDSAVQQEQSRLAAGTKK